MIVLDICLALEPVPASWFCADCFAEMRSIMTTALLPDPQDPPNSGLAVARQIAMVSYRTHNSYFTKFGG